MYIKQNLNQTEKQNHFAYNQMAYIRAEVRGAEDTAINKHVAELENCKCGYTHFQNEPCYTVALPESEGK